jgi:hypothetical protein
MNEIDKNPHPPQPETPPGTGSAQEAPQLREAVLAAIRAGKVAMRPKWHFLFRAALMAAGTALLILGLVYLGSLILFILHTTGVWYIPIFGFRGVLAFLISMPWVLVLLAIVFLALLEVLVSRYAFAYRRPLFYSALGVILLVGGGSVILANTRIHLVLSRRTESPLTRIYTVVDAARPTNVSIGIYLAPTRDGFIFRERHGETLRVFVTRETSFPRGAIFIPGDAMVIFGERIEEGIRAFGIRKLETESIRDIRMPSSMTELHWLN